MIDYEHIFRVQLTRRESQLTTLIGEGIVNNKELANRLGVTEGTMKVYKSKLAQKLGITCHDLFPILTMINKKNYMREQAIKINEWLKEFGDTIPDKAREKMVTIMGQAVVECIPDIKKVA